jgi:TetR/AcrR family transcriptional regulator, transcriptional repressor for nem operon
MGNKSTATRQLIVKKASEQFKSNGFAATGVDSVMSSTGLTHGGFYAHFKSKTELLDAAFEYATNENLELLLKAGDNKKGEQWIEALASAYLSFQHQNERITQCPIPTLGLEAVRSSDQVRSIFDKRMKKFLKEAVEHLSPKMTRTEAEERAIGMYATCVGGFILARLAKSNASARKILDASLYAVTGSREALR